MKSRTNTNTANTAKSTTNFTKSRRPSQAGKARMGRPANAKFYQDCVSQTRELMKAIKAGAPDTSHREIESKLGIGRDETGACSGRYLGRYLNSPQSKSRAALLPDRLSQIAQKAKDLGWIGQDEKLGCITKPGPFRHLEVPDGELLSERIVDLKTEQERLLKAQAGAIAALDNLVTQIAACKRAAFVHSATDVHDAQEVDVLLDGMSLDLEGVIKALGAARVVSEEAMQSGGRFY